MSRKNPEVVVDEASIDKQFQFIDFIKHSNEKKDKQLKAFTDTYGCQQNIADTQRIAGMLRDMGYEITDSEQDADIIVVNTCAIREHAELRVLGNIGNMSHLKKKNPDLIIAMCGCMVQQEHMTEKIKKSYPHVDLVFGTHAIWRFPELLYRTITGDKRVFDISGDDKGEIAEGLPILRDGKVHAWLSIMYGCNNFCTYCIVPYVRGRERSRTPETIEAELKELIAEGYRDITLLGQNVNSYGKDLGEEIDFADLLERLNEVDGDFKLRFMTSHPKDASHKLFDTMAKCDKVAKQLHLPFQSGSDEVLKKMNRGYTSEKYKSLIAYAREKMPEITVTSDVIVGFPGETEEAFLCTLNLVDDVKFDQLFTYLYSRRSGTPAAEMVDNSTKEEKQNRFDRLLELQNNNALERQAQYVGTEQTVLIDGFSKYPEYPMTGRTEGGLLVCCKGEDMQLGEFYKVKIVKHSLRALFGEE